MGILGHMVALIHHIYVGGMCRWQVIGKWFSDTCCINIFCINRNGKHNEEAFSSSVLDLARIIR